MAIGASLGIWAVKTFAQRRDRDNYIELCLKRAPEPDASTGCARNVEAAFNARVALCQALRDPKSEKRCLGSAHSMKAVESVECLSMLL